MCKAGPSRVVGRSGGLRDAGSRCCTEEPTHSERFDSCPPLTHRMPLVDTYRLFADRRENVFKGTNQKLTDA